MGRIRVLDPRVAGQIAAGEVVERPASVVKELVENALDAGATDIRIRVRRGGSEEIRVQDDGEGMEREDLCLALERHATSKISRLEELNHLGTFGFRGEALPSIASVSKLTLESSVSGTGEGTRIQVEGNRTSSPPEVIGHPRGTTVTVRSLFFNAPARRKFLRSVGTETDHVVNSVSRVALAHFDRRFVLEVDGKTTLDAAVSSERQERVRQIFGGSLTERLLPFAGDSGPYRVNGFISRPDFSRSSTREQWLYVNGRPVRDRGLLHGVAEAYYTLLPRGRHPFVLLFLDVPPERVDFNVHPTKWEVRLSEPRAAHDLVKSAIRKALERERPTPAWTPIAESSNPAREPDPPALALTRKPGAGLPAPCSGSLDPVRGRSGVTADSASTTLFDAPGSSSLTSLVPLAQYRESYILAGESRGLVIIDQHAAHERILYEQLLRQAEQGKVERQALLFPMNVELTTAQARRVEEGREELGRLGFVLEGFGGNNLLVREIPALLGKIDLVTLLRDLADELGESPGGRSLERRWDRLAATTACHAAVKVNFPLTREKMIFILEELGKTKVPMSCPHGRPVLLRLPQEDLEKRFLRR